MRNRTLLLMILLALAIFLPSPAGAQHPTSADAYVDETKLTTNFGAATTLSVMQPNLETFIRFDLSGLPSGVTGTSVGKATLVLYVSAVTAAGTFDVSEVGGTWNELTITGANEPALGTVITPMVPIALANKNNFVIIDVTAAVKDWLNGTANNGLALVPNGAAVNVTFNSKESTTTSHNPQLNISLIEPPGDITQITAGAGLTGGGTTANVTLAVDSTVIPFLNFSNTFTGNQTVTGNISASKLASTAPPGTAPLTVSSTTQVPNLNSSLLGGLGANAFAQLAAANVFTNTQSIGGNLALADTNGTGTVGVVTIGGNPLLHNCCGAGNNNVFVGVAGNFTTTGLLNTASGYQALQADSSGQGNTASGAGALNATNSGGFNTAAGYRAGLTNKTGYGNTFLGSNADAASANLTNATAIGEYAAVSASNSLVLGSGANVGIGTGSPAAMLDILPASNQHILLGDPGCAAGFSGIAFQPTLDCTNYALVGDSLNTYINRPTGGSIVFREGNAFSPYSQVQIFPSTSLYQIYTSTTAYLSSSGVWANASDRNLKTSFRAVNGGQILKRLNAIPIQSWSYKKEPGSIRHLGPTAQDFSAAFGLGLDDKHIGTVDADGVALAAIQELYRAGLKKDAKIRSQQASIDDLYAIAQQKDAQIRKLTADVQELLRDRGEVAALEARLAHLEGERQSASLLAKK